MYCLFFSLNVSRYMRADNRFNLHVNRIVQIEHARLHHGLQMHIFINIRTITKMFWLSSISIWQFQLKVHLKYHLPFFDPRFLQHTVEAFSSLIEQNNKYYFLLQKTKSAFMFAYLIMNWCAHSKGVSSLITRLSEVKCHLHLSNKEIFLSSVCSYKSWATYNQ